MRKILFVVMFTMVLLVSGCVPQNERITAYRVPHLPRPIARERAIITPAGQGVEGLVISQITSQLNIRNRFWRKVRGKDLSDRYDCVIIVLGISHGNMKRLKTDLTQEQQRLVELARSAKERGMAVVLVSMGKLYRHAGTDAISEAVAPHTDYVIVVGDGNYDGFFERLTAKANVPLTIVSDIEKIKTPLNSVFR
ncbi:MAG: hypothetical protein H0Z35_08300 [Thermoanaerobacteraceae bacterium]|nr:hypothetical protein [Thermoanaerobacteraceae bacterium]